MKYIKVIKKPIEVEGFEFIKDMMVKINPEDFKPKRTKEGISMLNNKQEEFKPEPKIYFSIFKDKVKCYVRTLEGNMEFKIGDWIIKGIQGEVYPIKKEIFEQTYQIKGK